MLIACLKASTKKGGNVTLTKGARLPGLVLAKCKVESLAKIIEAPVKYFNFFIDLYLETKPTGKNF